MVSILAHSAHRRPGSRLPGPFPEDDGWGVAYQLYGALIQPRPLVAALVRGYFWPARLERARGGLVFRLLGVPLFGRLVPTGGIAIRRLTGARMAPYTLAGPSLRAARAFFYRACIFEALHLVPAVLLVALSVHRHLSGRLDLAVENTAVNLVVNVYPILHHRHTRARILNLLLRRQQRPAPSACAAPLEPTIRLSSVPSVE